MSKAVFDDLALVSAVGTGIVGDCGVPTATVTVVMLGFVHKSAEQSQTAAVMTTSKAVYCVYEL